MTRVVSLFLPRWPTDRLRRISGDSAAPREAPLALAGRDGRRRVIAVLDEKAESLGLRIGMPVAKAQALAPELVLRPFTPQADAEGLTKLALWALRHVSPVVAVDQPDGLVIDSAGASHLHGGEGALLVSLVRRFAATGVEARGAIAGTWGAAHAAARFLPHAVTVTPPGAEEALLAPLPIAALRLDAGLVSDMQALGFERVRDLLGQPRAPLALRFGPEPGRRLDQALGRLVEPIDPVRPPECVEASRMFADPIGAAETIARHIGKLVVSLCGELERKGLGARSLDLRFERVDHVSQTVRVGLARPAREAKRLTRLLCDRIATVDPGFGVEKMILTASLTEPLGARQTVSSLIEEAEADIAGLIDSLSNRVGENALYRFAPVQSDVPERSVMRVAPLSPETGAAWEGDWPRPPRLLARPEPIETLALLPDHPPVWFAWRGVRRRIRRADGPERIRGEWWKREAERTTVRDYFRVEDEAGERFWLFRSGDGERGESGDQRWFLHGIFG